MGSTSRRPSGHGLPSKQASDGVDKSKLSVLAMSPTPSMGSEQSGASHLFPYRFFGSNSYLGDLECITSAMRKATVRCELEGKVLILKKPDLFELIEEFPHFGEMWASSAWRGE